MLEEEEPSDAYEAEPVSDRRSDVSTWSSSRSSENAERRRSLGAVDPLTLVDNPELRRVDDVEDEAIDGDEPALAITSSRSCTLRGADLDKDGADFAAERFGLRW